MPDDDSQSSPPDDEYAVPDGRRGEVLALAQQLRQDDGAAFVESEHVREAIRQLGLDVAETEIRDAEAGRDV